MPNAMTESQVTNKLALSSLRHRNWNLFGTCAIHPVGTGLYEGLDWLSLQLVN